MKNLICMFMIVMTVTIWFKYDKNWNKRSIQVEKVKLDDNGVLFCLDKGCGKNDNDWDGLVPYESIIMLQESTSTVEKKFEEESKY